MSQQLPTGRSASDWALFALLTLFWAGAYALTRVAVDKGNPDAGLPVGWSDASFDASRGISVGRGWPPRHSLLGRMRHVELSTACPSEVWPL